ncbi:Imm70 family immunity protein [Stenotrophomonas sp.]|uniref:Imm70 family immunity protein n=1 Tax=Stenotrophomonas sp. TaxID=69392 RepID=UPI00289BD2B3|nr:Imm70 family immunity protein [Stenotrophomonas sp.]
MTIAIRQGNVLTVIGPGGVLHSLFSTIAVLLENGKWGSRFPWIMNGLYGGSLADVGAKAAYDEMLEIRRELAQISPSEVVWDIENPELSPPWGNSFGSHVSHMADYYVTDTGRNLVDEIIDNLESQIEFGGPLQIVPFDGKH